MIKSLEEKFDRILNTHLTEQETQTVKKWILIISEIAVVSTVVVSLFFAWSHRTPWPALPIIFVAFYVGYRVYKRAFRRCPTCSVRVIRDEQGFIIEHRKKLFGGWFIRKNYWREDLPRCEVPEWIFRDHKKCIYHYICVSCGCDYEVKRPEVKSFRHRPPLFKNW